LKPGDRLKREVEVEVKLAFACEFAEFSQGERERRKAFHLRQDARMKWLWAA
jgi:hypothetical protein